LDVIAKPLPIPMRVASDKVCWLLAIRRRLESEGETNIIGKENVTPIGKGFDSWPGHV
jgi:hypothetical protein